MKLDPQLNALAVHLHGRRIGVLSRLVGDRHLFAFEQDYADDPHRPVLSLSFKESGGFQGVRLLPAPPQFRPEAGMPDTNSETCSPIRR